MPMDKILCCSCTVFLYSTIYAYYLNNYFMTLINFMTFSASFTHHATNVNGSIYHKIDLCTSRISMVVHSSLPLFGVLDNYLICFYMFNNITCAYILSYVVYKLYPESCLWKLFHVNFHIVVFVSQIYALQNFNNENKSLK